MTMERDPIRAWRRIKKIRKWHNRLQKLYFYFGYDSNGYHGRKEFESWRYLKEARWCKQYKDTGRPCNCPLCKGERYSRLKFSHETKRIVKEELFD